MINDPRIRAMRSLEGLSVGDAFGECFFHIPDTWIKEKRLPDPPWRWTDDTHMALSIVEVLLDEGRIDPDKLSLRFANRFVENPCRGYGGGAQRLLALLDRGEDWRLEAPKLFDGGSYGNGGAMRVAPLGAYFAGDPERSSVEAQRSAQVTHAHPEGQAGAIAVAVGASIIASADPGADTDLIKLVAEYIPGSRTRDRVVEAIGIEHRELDEAVRILGTGQQIAAFDTVPFCVWIAAHFRADWEHALWATVQGLGDRDTTCAIVGGMIATVTLVPEEWLRRREPLPESFAINHRS